MGTRAMSSATTAAQKGCRLMIAEMIMGWALLSPSLNINKPDHPDDK